MCPSSHFALRTGSPTSEQFFTGDVMIRHEPGVRDGVKVDLRSMLPATESG
jgi:hypothetical protein